MYFYYVCDIILIGNKCIVYLGMTEKTCIMATLTAVQTLRLNVSQCEAVMHRTWSTTSYARLCMNEIWYITSMNIQQRQLNVSFVTHISSCDPAFYQKNSLLYQSVG